MKKFIYFAAAAMAAFSACNMEIQPVETVTGGESFKAPVFTATIEGPATKTTLGAGNKVNWENGDEVVLIFETEDMENRGVYNYQVTPDNADASKATLTRNTVLDEPDDGEVGDRLSSAVYPASLWSGEFPETQVYAGDDNIGFAPMHSYNWDLDNGTVKPTPETIEFKNAAALLKITVPYTQMTSVRSIIVSSDVAMHGYLSFSVREYSLFITDERDPGVNDHLILDCYGGNGNANVEIPEGDSKTFYIALPIPVIADGEKYGYLQIDVTDGTTTKSMRTNKAGGIEIERNKIYPINFAENYSPAPAYEYVDLGLSVKWATMNVGATKPEEYGDYFAWGATEPLYEAGHAQDNPQEHWKAGRSAGYTYVNTPYQTANTTSHSSTRWTKYLGSTTSSYKDPSATDANALKTVLDPEDDAAHVNWGGSWRMPTSVELYELYDNCTWTWTTLNGVNGYKVQSKKAGYTDKWIFLPAAGFRDESTIGRVDNEGNYWSSSLFTGDSYMAHQFYFFGSSSVNMSFNPRLLGLSVRPVCE